MLIHSLKKLQKNSYQKKISIITDSVEEKNELIIKDLSNDLMYNEDMLIKNEHFDLDLQVSHFKTFLKPKMVHDLFYKKKIISKMLSDSPVSLDHSNVINFNDDQSLYQNS